MNLSDKRILLIIHEGVLGGAERQALGLAKFLTEQRNCKVDLLLTFSNVTTKEFDQYAEHCSLNNVYHFGFPYLILKKEFTIMNLKRLKWSLQYLWKLRNGLYSNKPDIIIPFLNFPSKVAYFLYRLMPSVKFTFWHQLGLDVLSYDLLERIAAKNTPCVIANARNGLEMFKDIYLIDPKKLNILPQYISLEYKNFNKEKVKIEFGIPKKSIVIGMVAHYRPEKYHELLLNVFEKLVIKNNNIYLVFLGNKNNSIVTQRKYKYLENKIRSSNLSSRVTLLSGFKVEKILAMMDIGVLVSRIEGMPNAVMEYMLYGLPVVATNHPGCVELLKESPFLIENNEPQLLDSLNKLLGSSDLRNTEGTLNLEKIKAYNIPSYVNKMEVIMNKTLNL